MYSLHQIEFVNISAYYIVKNISSALHFLSVSAVCVTSAASRGLVEALVGAERDGVGLGLRLQRPVQVRLSPPSEPEQYWLEGLEKMVYTLLSAKQTCKS